MSFRRAPFLMSTNAHDRRAKPRPDQGPFARVVERNIAALLEQRKQEDKRRRAQDRVADAITRFTGSMVFVYIHLAIYGAWILTNLGWLPGLARLKDFDKGFTVLAMEASVEAIFLSTFVLISQNRMQTLSDKRADLDLQVSLLAEHEVTELIRLVRGMAAKMEVDEARNPEIDELAEDVRPETVMSRIEAAEAQNAMR
ncbi:MAG TPA: DUF1003 domain-containing protein [Gemmatirosa sp.]